MESITQETSTTIGEDPIQESYPYLEEDFENEIFYHSNPEDKHIW